MQVVNYSLARPAREVLYTVVGSEEKYTAKMCIDTVILRSGDTIGATVFQGLDTIFKFGSSGLAAAAVPVCLTWGAIAFKLGQKQQQLARQQYTKS